jgi:hypothetical protein
LNISATRIDKLCKELEQILVRTSTRTGCEVYFLRTRNNGTYPILGYGNAVIGVVDMKINEVWKVGKTCIGQGKRYSGKTYYTSKDGKILLDENLLRFEAICSGTETLCLITEKILIYTYPLWSGYPYLVRPPGGKVDR